MNWESIIIQLPMVGIVLYIWKQDRKLLLSILERFSDKINNIHAKVCEAKNE